MKFLVPNYSCLRNPWLGGYRPQIHVLSVLCPQLKLLNPPRTKFLGTPLHRRPPFYIITIDFRNYLQPSYMRNLRRMKYPYKETLLMQGVPFMAFLTTETLARYLSGCKLSMRWRFHAQGHVKRDTNTKKCIRTWSAVTHRKLS